MNLGRTYALVERVHAIVIADGKHISGCIINFASLFERAQLIDRAQNCCNKTRR